MFERLRPGKQLEPNVYLPSRSQRSRLRERHAAHEFVSRDACKIDGGTLPGLCPICGRAVYLNPTRTRPIARRMDLKLLLAPYGTGNKCPGNDRAKSLHHKRTIDWKARLCVRVPGSDFRSDSRKFALQLIDALTGNRAHCHDRRLLREVI